MPSFLTPDVIGLAVAAVVCFGALAIANDAGRPARQRRVASVVAWALIAVAAAVVVYRLVTGFAS